MVIQHFRANLLGRDFVIGDLHGCYDLLMQKMKEVDFDKTKDRIFATGDLVDRGPKNLECLGLLYEPYFFSVRGNHDDMMCASILDQCMASYQCWMMNGGAWALQYISPNNIDKAFYDTVKAVNEKLPLAFEVETRDGHTVGILHADPPQFWNVALIRDMRQKTLWGRDRVKSKSERLVRDIDKVYIGHSFVEEPLTLGNVRCLDTGACFNGNLTMEEIWTDHTT